MLVRYFRTKAWYIMVDGGMVYPLLYYKIILGGYIGGFSMLSEKVIGTIRCV